MKYCGAGVFFELKMTINWCKIIKLIRFLCQGELSMEKGSKNNIEYDVKEESWQLYSCLYKDAIGKIDFNKDVKNNNRRSIETSFTHNGKSVRLNMSGETDFNFSEKKVFGLSCSRIEHYEKYLNKLPNKEKYLEQLERCKKKHHSQQNISLMPQTGNFQGVKKHIGNDRLDTFVWALNEYYLRNNYLLFNFSSFDNLPIIKQYLDIFGGVNDYCKSIYFIEEKLVTDLIVSGKKPIDSPERVIEYMNLAEEFWKQKDIYISSVTNV